MATTNNNLYTTKTASLKATKADIMSVNAQKMTLGGKTIPEIIDENMIKVQTSTANLTGLTSITDNGVVTLTDGKMNLTFKGDNNPFKTVTMVKDGEGFDANGSKVINLSTEKIKSLFWDDWGSIATGITNQSMLFPVMEEWYGDLSSLESLGQMEHGFVMSLPEFYDLCWFGPNLHTFIGDIGKLKMGWHMFADTNLETFIGDLSSLESGGVRSSSGMFYNTNLSLESVECIADTIRDLIANPIASTFAPLPPPVPPSYTTETISNGVIHISWKSLTADTELQKSLVKEMNKIVQKGWMVVTNTELKTLASSLGYTISNGSDGSAGFYD